MRDLLLLLGCCCLAAAVHVHAQTDEKILVRIELDLNGAAQGSIRPDALANWSAQRRIVRAFEGVDVLRSSGPSVLERRYPVEDVISQSLTRTNPAAIRAAVAMNRITPDSGNYLAVNAPLFVAPLATARINTSKPFPPDWSNPITTYSEANQSQLQRLYAGVDLTEFTRVLVPDIVEPSIGVPKRSTVQLELTRAELSDLRKQNPTMVHRTLNGKFPVTFGGLDQVDVKPLDEIDAAILDISFKGKSRVGSRPLLIIVDDSWPDDESFLATKNVVGSNFEQLWKINSDLAAAASPPELSDEVKRLPGPGVPDGSNCATLPNCDTHARRVQRAIAPLRERAKAKLGEEPVDIIYVPLAASQKGSIEILRLLWNLAYASGTNIAPNSPTFFGEETTRKRQESEFLGSLQRTLPKGTFQSNWAIVDSVANFAHRYAQLKQVPVYLNFSWTTEDLSFNSPVLTDWNTLIVAAAGNHCLNDGCGKFADQMDPPRLFVARAERPIDVLLVVNVDDRGRPTCNSSRIRVNYAVVGFDGALTGDCGTSFATPRVAWLLAARAAISVAPLTPKEQINRLKWLMSLDPRRKCASDDDFKCVRLTVSDLLSLGARSQ